MQTPMRDGLRWMNETSTQRFGRPFVEATAAQRRELLDAIAYPKRAAAGDKAGVEFFNRFPRSDGVRLLVESDRRGGPPLPRKHGRGAVDRLSSGRAAEGWRQTASLTSGLATAPSGATVGPTDAPNAVPNWRTSGHRSLGSCDSARMSTSDS